VDFVPQVMKLPGQVINIDTLSAGIGITPIGKQANFQDWFLRQIIGISQVVGFTFRDYIENLDAGRTRNYTMVKREFQEKSGSHPDYGLILSQSGTVLMYFADRQYA